MTRSLATCHEAGGEHSWLVYLVVTDRGAVALLTDTGREVGVVDIAGFTRGRLAALVGSEHDPTRGHDIDLESPSWLAAYRERDILPGLWKRTLAAMLDALEPLATPLARALAERGARRVALILAGGLALLPFHAALELAWCQDHQTDAPLAITHAPSLDMLAQAVRSLPDDDDGFDMQAVLNPAPSGLPPLHDARDEVELIQPHFWRPWGQGYMAPRVTTGEYADVDAATMMLGGEYHAIIHFACHAQSNLETPEDSGIFLAHDRLLRVREIMRRDVYDLRMAVLAACETGMVPANLGDEVIGLPGALLHAGCSGVVASLWSVPELSTALLMVRFYDEWLHRDHPPAAALARAQRWLRDTTNAEKAAYFDPESPLPYWRCGPDDVRADIAAARSRLHAALIGSPGARPFEPPYYWAGFYMTGI